MERREFLKLGLIAPIALQGKMAIHANRIWAQIEEIVPTESLKGTIGNDALSRLGKRTVTLSVWNADWESIGFICLDLDELKKSMGWTRDPEIGAKFKEGD